MRPADQAVPARQLHVFGHRLHVRTEGLMVFRFVSAGHALVRVPLERDGVALGRRPVGTHSAHAGSPVVVGAVPRCPAGVPIEPLTVDPVVDVVADFTAVLGGRKSALEATGPALDQDPRRVLRPLGDDVDDPVDGIGSPDAGPRTADHLDPFDILQDDVLNVPKDAAEQRGIHTATVHLDEQLVGESRVEAANADGPLVRVDARHLDAGGHAEHFRKAPGTAAADHLVGDHEHGGRGPAHRADLPGDRGHLRLQRRSRHADAAQLRRVLLGQGEEFVKVSAIGGHSAGLGTRLRTGRFLRLHRRSRLNGLSGQGRERTRQRGDEDRQRPSPPANGPRAIHACPSSASHPVLASQSGSKHLAIACCEVRRAAAA